MAAARPLLPQPAAFGAATKAEAKQNEKNSGGNALRHAAIIPDRTHRREGRRSLIVKTAPACPVSRAQRSNIPLIPAQAGIQQAPSESDVLCPRWSLHSGPAKPDPRAGTSGNITLLNGTLRPGQKAEPDSTTAYTAVRLCRVKQVRFVA
jgi:hypothetical protein